MLVDTPNLGWFGKKTRCWQKPRRLKPVSQERSPPENRFLDPKGNEKVFQPSIFRCELLASGRVLLDYLLPFWLLYLASSFGWWTTPVGKNINLGRLHVNWCKLLWILTVNLEAFKSLDDKPVSNHFLRFTPLEEWQSALVCSCFHIFLAWIMWYVLPRLLRQAWGGWLITWSSKPWKHDVEPYVVVIIIHFGSLLSIRSWYYVHVLN